MRLFLTTLAIVATLTVPATAHADHDRSEQRGKRTSIEVGVNTGNRGVLGRVFGGRPSGHIVFRQDTYRDTQTGPGAGYGYPGGPIYGPGPVYRGGYGGGYYGRSGIPSYEGEFCRPCQAMHPYGTLCPRKGQFLCGGCQTWHPLDHPHYQALIQRQQSEREAYEAGRRDAERDARSRKAGPAPREDDEAYRRGREDARKKANPAPEHEEEEEENERFAPPLPTSGTPKTQGKKHST